MNLPHGTSLANKLSATFSEGFVNQYNSPKTFNGKGFSLSKSSAQNPNVYSRQQKEASGFTQTKVKAIKGTSPTPEPKTLGQKTLSNSALDYQVGRSKEEKRSSSKLKCETLRTVSSTPKGPLPYKGAESVRRDESEPRLGQPRWKKLEITTDFANTKSSYANKAQTTKHTEAEENLPKETSSKFSAKQSTLNSLQKTLQAKKDNYNSYNFYTQNNEEAKGKTDKAPVDLKSRTPRPLTSYGSTKTSSSSPAQPGSKGLMRTSSYKDNVKLTVSSFPSEREKSVSKASYRKEKSLVNATPKATLTHLAGDDSLGQVANKKYLTTVNADLKSPYQSETGKSKARPMSAKKVAKEAKDDTMTERATPKDDKGTNPQKASLQNFVTKVNRGDMFGGANVNKYGDSKRDNSVKRAQKPQLNIEEKSSKPVRAIDIDLKGTKTTTNSETRGFNNVLTKSAAQLSPSASAQSLLHKNNNKNPKGQKAVNDVPRPRAQGKEPFIYYMTGLEKAHRWAGGLDYFSQLYREHFLQSFQALNFCKSLKPIDPSVINSKKVDLPGSSDDKKTLIFDMDETLIHCNETTDMPADVILPIHFPTGEVIEAGINVRPYALECLRELGQYYEIVVFTASHACYANAVLDYLDPRQELIKYRLFRESCVVTDEGVHIKDLRVIGNRKLEDLILVDNAAYSFGFQIENGIPIIPFYESKNDQELRHLIPYLKFLSSVKDIREVIKQTFKLHSYTSYESPEAVLEKVVFQG